MPNCMQVPSSCYIFAQLSDWIVLKSSELTTRQIITCPTEPVYLDKCIDLFVKNEGK